MKRACLICILLLAALPGLTVGQTLTHVRLEEPNAAALALRLERAGFDVLEGSVTESSVDLIVTPEDLLLLEQAGHFPIIIAVGRPFRDIQAEWQQEEGVPPGYPNLAAIYATMNAAATNYPTICKMVDLTVAYGVAPTWEGRHMFAVKVSDNVAADEDEPVFLLVSCHHAREIVTPVIALEALNRLTSQYGTDPTITSLVNKYEIWIAPVWNPDGYEYVFNVDNMWRKNRHVFTGGIGVDLNRNYPLGWSSACAGSTNPSSETYKGPAPASESETQTMLAWSDDRHFAKVVDYHSYGREVLYGYACLSHPLVNFLKSEATALASASGYGGSTRPPSAEGEHYEWQLGLHGAHAWLIETALDFQPSYSAAQSEAALVWPGIVWLLQRSIPLGGHVTDAPTGQPVVAKITISGVNYPNGEVNASNARFGRYHLFLPTGSYTLQFAAPGYVTQSVPVSINTAVEQTLDIALLPAWGQGDMNCDGAVNFGDINPFVLALSGQAGYQAALPNCRWLNGDINGDGTVDFADINPFVALLTQ